MQDAKKYWHNSVFLAGHTGMVGSATLAELQNSGYSGVLTAEPDRDLRQQDVVDEIFEQHRPKAVIIAAARVGGILANSRYPYDFIYDNLAIEANLVNAALKHGVKKLVFLGSSCIYPKLAPQPLREEYLLTGPLEPTNEWYATAKIAGIKLCQAVNRQYGLSYVSLMPTNLYGERDNFDLESSHVIPAMMRKFHEALPDKEVVLWGSGKPMREFMHVWDLARAIRFILETECQDDLYNVGTGIDISISDLAMMMQKTVGHKGKIVWDTDKPDGTPRKLLNVHKINQLGWKHEIGLEQGIKDTYEWMKTNINNLREIKHD
ncbi:MAG TPA: GDP-L-fucose synthase [Candidatus Syntrophosphaera sp.]|nr:GDP-L-fucose synthase [Candidatus Cloacimonadota bacterium]HOR02707.1 GDP-L-fucose synthase [Candidatus Syntrophosphaera sp.]